MMIKNILIIYTGRTGAGISYAYEMCKGFLKNGAHVYAVISKQSNNFDDWGSLPLEKIVGINTYTNKQEFIFNTILFFLFKRKYIKKEFINVKFDAVYVPMGTYWSSMISSLFPDVPVYYTIHDITPHSGENLFNKIWCYFAKREIKNAYRVIVLSRMFIPDVKNMYNKMEKDIVFLPHAAFWQYVDKYKANNFSYLSYQSKKINFIFFGRIEKYKGLNILIEAYRQLYNEIGDKITLTIAGKGHIDNFAGIKQLSGITIINEMIPEEDIGALFDGPNIVTVLPYIDATQSGVVPTAAMFNSLTIVSDAGALPEQVGNGKYGVIIKANNIDSLKKAMLDVVVNYSKYMKIKKQANAYVKSLTWEKLARKVIDEVE